jgi:hypothetical protein
MAKLEKLKRLGTKIMDGIEKVVRVLVCIFRLFRPFLS